MYSNMWQMTATNRNWVWQLRHRNNDATRIALCRVADMTPPPVQLEHEHLQGGNIFTIMCDKNMQLVKAIEKFPCLYNYNLPEYLKKDISDKAWHGVASQTLMSVAECKEKWKNLRYGLLRSLRLNPDGTGKRKYYLHDEMEFVVPYIRSSKLHDTVLQQMREDIETDEEVNGFHDQDHQDISPLQLQYQEIEIPEPSRKKSRSSDHFIKYLQHKPINNSEVVDDSRKMFLLSLLPEVNALSEYQMRVFRRKILLLLDEIVDSPGQYEMCLLQWQKESISQDGQRSSNNDTIKNEPVL